MLKKRIIFVLLYSEESFMLSRNFRLQKVGTLNWLKKNYDFSRISFYIDELMVLDVSRNNRDTFRFADTLKKLSEGCFLPISAGGGIRSINDARILLKNGADKIVVNTSLISNTLLVKELSEEFGQQCIIGSIDVKKNNENRQEILIENGTKKIDSTLEELLENLPINCIGELFINSIDRDGTGNGLDLNSLEILGNRNNLPIIIGGGVGNNYHFLSGLNDSRVNAVATANLLNFIGDGLKNCRSYILEHGINLAYWPTYDDYEIILGEL
jgi:cyclase